MHLEPISGRKLLVDLLPNVPVPTRRHNLNIRNGRINGEPGRDVTQTEVVRQQGFERAHMRERPTVSVQNAQP